MPQRERKGIRRVLLSIALALPITGGLTLVAYLKRASVFSGYEFGAADIAAFVVGTIVLALFLYLKVIDR